jgi:hypothetical protein
VMVSVMVSEGGEPATPIKSMPVRAEKQIICQSSVY